MRRPKSSDAREGIATVELAILLPFLVFVFLIAVDWARIFYYTVTIENAARQGALYCSDPYMAQQSPYANVTAAALADCSNLSPAPTVTTTNGTDSAGNQFVEVTVQWQFSTVTDFPGIPNINNISRTVQVRVAPLTPNP